MTEYWVSQGNKWCDYCKIYIANNPVSIRTHEFGQRHKDNVANKLAAIRKENANKEKEKKQAVKDLERIEAQAKKSYAKDLEASKKGSQSSTDSKASCEKLPTAPFGSTEGSKSGTTTEWTYDSNSGYYFNAVSGYYYDQNSGLYYSDSLGKWVTQADAFKASETTGSENSNNAQKASSVSNSNFLSNSLSSAELLSIKLGVEPPQSQSRAVRGVPSSIAVGKRKREDKSAQISKEEAAALAAREAAKKRTQEREKNLLGLYSNP